MRNRRFTGYSVVLLAAGLAACDKMPLLAPINSSVTITATTVTVPLGGSTEVSAFVAEPSGTPVQNGTMVRFTASLGRVDPVEVETLNGRAVTTFFAGNVSGVADVRATSGGGGVTTSTGSGGTTTSSTASNLVQISVGLDRVVDSVTIRANPAVVSSTGGTVDVIATVRSTAGPISGVSVTFSTTAGTLNPGSALTDENGEARTRLTTNATATVSATSGGKSTSAGATVTALPGPSVSLTCAVGATGSCTAVSLGQAVTFTAQRGATTSLIRTAVLEFGDGNSLDLGPLASPVTVSHAYGAVGTYTARLTVTDINGESTSVVQPVRILAPVSVLLTTAKDGLKVTATATVTGATAVQFEWTFEGSTPNLVTTTNSAEFTYASASISARTISVRVTLSDGRTATASVSVVVP